MALPLFIQKFLIRTGISRMLPMTDRLSYGASDFLPYYSDKVLSAPLDELLDTAAFPDAVGPDVMNLNLATPRFDSPVTGGRVSGDRMGLPPANGLMALRLAIAEQARSQLGRIVDPREEVAITHGATGALSACLDAFVNPGDTVVLFEPCSPMFRIGAKSRRANIRTVPTTVQNGQLTFDADQLVRSLRGAMMLVLANPCNPTGAVLSPETWEQIAGAANHADVLLFVDESFARFRYDNQPRLNYAGAESRLLLAGSISQSEGLSSVRLGWVVGHKHLIRPTRLMGSLSAPYVPTICQQIALRAIQADEELFGPVLEEFQSRRRYTFEKLEAMGLPADMPAGGYAFWVDVKSTGLTGRGFAERLFTEFRVLVGPGDVFGASGANHVRISFAEEDGRLREGLSRLNQFLNSLKGAIESPAVEEEETTPESSEELPPTFSRV
jgi:aspartate/methionine/tyrosine aminotransferase